MHATVEIDDTGAATIQDGCGTTVAVQYADGRVLPVGNHSLDGCLDDSRNAEASRFDAVVGGAPSAAVVDGVLQLRLSNGDGADLVPL